MTTSKFACLYFSSKDMQSVHSYCVGFFSCVPIVMEFKAQYSPVCAWFLHCVTVHLMLEFALQAITIPPKNNDLFLQVYFVRLSEKY